MPRFRQDSSRLLAGRRRDVGRMLPRPSRHDVHSAVELGVGSRAWSRRIAGHTSGETAPTSAQLSASGFGLLPCDRDVATTADLQMHHATRFAGSRSEVAKVACQCFRVYLLRRLPPQYRSQMSLLLCDVSAQASSRHQRKPLRLVALPVITQSAHLPPRRVNERLAGSSSSAPSWPAYVRFDGAWVATKSTSLDWRRPALPLERKDG